MAEAIKMSELPISEGSDSSVGIPPGVSQLPLPNSPISADESESDEVAFKPQEPQVSKQKTSSGASQQLPQTQGVYQSTPISPSQVAPSFGVSSRFSPINENNYGARDKDWLSESHAPRSEPLMSGLAMGVRSLGRQDPRSRYDSGYFPAPSQNELHSLYDRLNQKDHESEVVNRRLENMGRQLDDVHEMRTLLLQLGQQVSQLSKIGDQVAQLSQIVHDLSVSVHPPPRPDPPTHKGNSPSLDKENIGVTHDSDISAHNNRSAMKVRFRSPSPGQVPQSAESMNAQDGSNLSHHDDMPATEMHQRQHWRPWTGSPRSREVSLAERQYVPGYFPLDPHSQAAPPFMNPNCYYPPQGFPPFSDSPSYPDAEREQAVSSKSPGDRVRGNRRGETVAQSSDTHTDSSDSDTCSDSGSLSTSEGEHERRHKYSPHTMEKMERRSRRRSRTPDTSSDSSGRPCGKAKQKPRHRSRKHRFYSSESDHYSSSSRNKHRHPRSTHRKNKPMDTPFFRGGADNLRSFLIQFKVASEDNQWSYREQGRRLIGALRGDARDVLGVMGQGKAKDFDKLVKTLTRTYCPPGSEQKYAVELLSKRYSKSKESLASYALSLKQLAVRAYPDSPTSPKHLCDMFIRGLPRSMRKLVAVQRCTSIDEALVCALTLEANDNFSDNEKSDKPRKSKQDNVGSVKSSSKNKKGSNRKGKKSGKGGNREGVTGAVSNNDNSSNDTKLAEMFEKQSERLEALEKRFQRKPLSEVLCYSCNQFGHFRNQCPDLQYTAQGHNPRSEGRSFQGQSQHGQNGQGSFRAPSQQGQHNQSSFRGQYQQGQNQSSFRGHQGQGNQSSFRGQQGQNHQSSFRGQPQPSRSYQAQQVPRPLHENMNKPSDKHNFAAPVHEDISDDSDLDLNDQGAIF